MNRKPPLFLIRQGNSDNNIYRGELIVVFREYEEYYFVITAFWNKRGEKGL